jgi:osmotically-inducible protein OsmY
MALFGGLAVAAALALSGEASEAADPGKGVSQPTWNAAERVDLRLAGSRGLAGARVETHGTDGEVVLRGSVRDAGQRERARQIAARTEGVREVRDELVLDPGIAAAARRPDEELARSVAEALASDDVLRPRLERGWLLGWRVAGEGWGVDVEVDDGDVWLEGTALLQQHIHEFVLEARAVPGVRSVRSDIGLRPNPEPPDALHEP